MNEVYEKIQLLLNDEFGLENLNCDTPIFSSNLLDSLDVLRLILNLERFFSIKIPAFDVTIEMFDTLNGITEIVIRKLADK